MLAADLLCSATSFDQAAVQSLGGDISTQSQPAITVPGNQSTTEGASLVFTPAAGREIRIDAPGLGAGALRVDISAFNSLGQVTPILSFGSTAGLTVTGNGVNVFQLQGTLANINAALATLAFYSPDNGDFTISLLATDPSTGESANESIDINVANISPQISLQPGGGTEGSIIELPIELFDPGAFDNPQVSWSVSKQNAVIASGGGSPVHFFANNDGVYKLTLSAVDKDGGVTSLTQDVLIANVDPSLELTGSMQGDLVNLHVVITDPGHELFTVQIFWTDQSASPEVFVTRDRILSFSHRYLPGEIDSELNIAVQVDDDHTFVRQTLQFREGEPVSAERPEFASRPQESPPDRAAPSRIPPGGTTSQIVSADFGHSATHGTQAVPALHQFVLRVVGPDGEESESYPLPAEALANLPEFLTRLGVPDGHYRIYLIAGELERLVIDGHLRAGRIVDPNDEPQGEFDFAQREVADDGMSHVIPNAPAMPPMIMGQPTSAAIANDQVDADHAASTSTVEFASPEVIPTDSFKPKDTASTAGHEIDQTDASFTTPILSGAIVVSAAASAAFATTRRRSKAYETSPRFCKRARLARKLAHRRPASAPI